MTNQPTGPCVIPITGGSFIVGTKIYSHEDSTWYIHQQLSGPYATREAAFTALLQMCL